MFSREISGDPLFRKFVRKRLLGYIIPNVLFNTSIPYFTFKHMSAVYLFGGELCFARFLLPMAFFLPFIITLDLLKKTIALGNQGKLNFKLPEEIHTGRFLFVRAGFNGMITLVVAALMTLFVQFCLPVGYGFDGTWLSVILGACAAMITLIFTFLSLRLIQVPSSVI